MSELFCGIILKCFHSSIFIFYECIFFIGWIFIFLLPSSLDGLTPLQSILTLGACPLLFPLFPMIPLFSLLSSPNNCHLLQMDPLFAE